MSSAGKSPKSSVGMFVLKIWTVHIVSLVAYLFVLVLVAQFLEDTTSVILGTVVSTAAYVVFIYLDAWRTGQRDFNLVKYGHIKEDKLKGLKAAVISQLPGLILAVVLAFFKAPDIAGQAYRWIYLFFCSVVNLIAEKTAAAYFIPLIFAPIIAAVGYQLGYTDKRLINKIVFTTNKDHENLR
jgi:hypothetical protein